MRPCILVNYGIYCTCYKLNKRDGNQKDNIPAFASRQLSAEHFGDSALQKDEPFYTELCGIVTVKECAV